MKEKKGKLYTLVNYQIKQDDSSFHSKSTLMKFSVLKCGRWFRKLQKTYLMIPAVRGPSKTFGPFLYYFSSTASGAVSIIMCWKVLRIHCGTLPICCAADKKYSDILAVVWPMRQTILLQFWLIQNLVTSKVTKVKLGWLVQQQNIWS